MKLSVIVPSLDGRMPRSLVEQVKGHPDVEIVSVVGVRPVSKARNEGLARATGEYLAWVDADDEVSPDWLDEIERQVKELGEGEQRIDVLLFDAYNDGCTYVRGDFVYGRPKADVREVVKDVYENEVLFSHLWRTVTRRELWEGLRFDETITYGLSDFQLLPSVLMRAKHLVYLPKKLYRYVYRAGNISTNPRPECLDNNIRLAIRRWREAPLEYRKAAAQGSVFFIYAVLFKLMLDPERCGRTHDVKSLHAGMRFLLRHGLSVRCASHQRMRVLCAGLNFWAPIRFLDRK